MSDPVISVVEKSLYDADFILVKAGVVANAEAIKPETIYTFTNNAAHKGGGSLFFMLDGNDSRLTADSISVKGKDLYRLTISAPLAIEEYGDTPVTIQEGQKKYNFTVSPINKNRAFLNDMVNKIVNNYQVVGAPDSYKDVPPVRYDPKIEKELEEVLLSNNKSEISEDQAPKNQAPSITVKTDLSVGYNKVTDVITNYKDPENHPMQSVTLYAEGSDIKVFFDNGTDKVELLQGVFTPKQLERVSLYVPNESFSAKVHISVMDLYGARGRQTMAIVR